MGVEEAVALPFDSSRGRDASNVCKEETLSPYKWFLSPHSWGHFHSCDVRVNAGEVDASVSQETLPRYIEKQQSWLRAWTKDGHSPLMHRQLYRHSKMLPCIRAAYTARAAYDLASSGSGAKVTALRIMEELATELVCSQPEVELDPASILSNMVGTSTDSGAVPVILDTFTHLARTQALFIYQITQLFDGDIRARDKAEGHIETLHRWSRQMLESARLDCAAAEVLTTDETQRLLHCERLAESGIRICATRVNPFTMPAGAKSTPPTLWQAWVIAESVRRTYISARFVQAVYDAIKRGWAMCPGGIMFAAHVGLWDAETEAKWYAAVRQADISSPFVLMQSLDGHKILEGATPEDVDEFAKSVVEISFGVEQVERWLMEKGHLSRESQVRS